MAVGMDDDDHDVEGHGDVYEHDGDVKDELLRVPGFGELEDDEEEFLVRAPPKRQRLSKKDKVKAKKAKRKEKNHRVVPSFSSGSSGDDGATRGGVDDDVLVDESKGHHIDTRDGRRFTAYV